MKWPNWNEFENFIDQVETTFDKFQIKLDEGFTKFQTHHPLINEIISKLIPIMPFPINQIIQSIYDKYDDKIQATKEVFEYLEKLSLITEENYRQIEQQLKSLQIDLAKEETLLQVKKYLYLMSEKSSQDFSYLEEGQLEINNKINQILDILRFQNSELQKSDENHKEIVSRFDRLEDEIVHKTTLQHKRPCQIFVSSVMREFSDVRTAIRSIILNTRNMPILIEDQVDVENSPKKAIEELVSSCDAYIGIFHDKWGWVPTNENPEKLSVTAIEYNIAKKIGLPRLILVSNLTKEPQLQEFIEKISDYEKGILYKKYDDIPSLIGTVGYAAPKLCEKSTIMSKSYKMPKKKLELEKIQQTHEAEIEENYKINIRKYVNYAKTASQWAHPQDEKTIEEYYYPSDMVSLSIADWTLKDDDARNKGKQFSWNTFFENESFYTVIGAPFGIGKTTFARIMTAKTARDYLKDESRKSYVPILVQLNNGFNRIYGDYDLDLLLEEIIVPTSKYDNTKILLILDGLDEYKAGPEDLIGKIRQLRKKYLKLKVIITTRLEAGYPQALHLTDDSEYIRLLQFTESQVNAFLEKYGVDLDYFQLLKFNLDEEEIKKPLFCWMLALARDKFDSELEFKKEWSSEIKRTVLYLEFSNLLLKGKYRLKNSSYQPELFVKEKKILRKIAALKQIYAEDLTDEILLKEIKLFDDIKLDQNNVDEILNPILSAYFYLHEGHEKRHISFVHKTFQEYALAEYYVESILKNIPSRLCVGTPSVPTIDFLKGLLEILALKDDDLIPYQTQILQTLVPIKQKNQIKNVVENIIHNTKSFFYLDHVFVHNLEPSAQKELWNIVPINLEEYKSLLIYKWISIFTLNVLGVTCKDLDSSILLNIIKNTTNLVPHKLKMLTNAELSKINLPDANMALANLSRVNFAESYLYHTNLTGSKLQYANFYKTNLFSVDLHNTDLSNSNLSNSILFGADLRGANLYNANLVDAYTLEVIVDENTITKNIKLVEDQDCNSPEKIKAAIEKLEPKLRKKILDDNPLYQEYL